MCPYSLEINIRSSFFCTSGKETKENLKISLGQLAPCQESRIKRQQTVSSAECKVLIPNASFLLASMPSYCRLRPIECCYSQSVSVSVPQDKIRGSAISRPDNVDSPIDRGLFHQPLQLLSVLCRSQLVQARAPNPCRTVASSGYTVAPRPAVRRARNRDGAAEPSLAEGLAAAPAAH